MQRSDLTALEEADGFQYCLDLGASIHDVREKTGLSEKTIRDRLKLRELDRDAAEKALESGVTLFDMLRIQKLTDESERLKCLKASGTKDFNWTLDGAEKRDAQKKLDAEIVEILSRKCAECDLADGEYYYNRYFYEGKIVDTKSAEKWVEEHADDYMEYFYNAGNYGVEIYTKKQERELTADEELAARQTADLERRRKLGVELFEQAYKARKTFLDGANPKISDVVELLDAEVANFQWTSQKYKPSKPTTPDNKKLLTMLRHFWGDHKDMGYSTYNMEYQINAKLCRIYSGLILLGYKLSDEEQQLRDGTHEIYKSGV